MFSLFFLFAPPTFAARFSDVLTSAEANTIDVGGSPQCRHKFVNQHGLPPIVEAMVRLRATLTSRGYFQHVPRETCWSKIYGWSFDSLFFAVNFFFRRCCLSDTTRRNVFWCKGAFPQMPSTREEICFHMKERDPPGKYHFGRAVGGACYHQFLAVLELAALLATIKWVRSPRREKTSWEALNRCPRDISRFFFNATSAWTVAT